MTYQLVPPHDHRRNKAEKAIQTFKDHFVAILCGADTSFPLNLWDLLLRQAEHTLNMLRPARMTPTVSAYTYLWGQHDYNISLPWDAKSNRIWYPASERHGHHIRQVVTTWELLGNTTDATKYISSTPGTHGYAVRYSSNTNISRCHP
jgi:hypothetical protein